MLDTRAMDGELRWLQIREIAVHNQSLRQSRMLEDEYFKERRKQKDDVGQMEGCSIGRDGRDDTYGGVPNNGHDGIGDRH